MDVSSPSAGTAAAPRAVPDLRPSADAAATARIVRPPSDALAPPPATAPVSVTQAALVSRSAMEPSEPDKAAAWAEDAPPRGAPASERVLKPFGVNMLPSREGDVPAGREAEPDGAAAREPEGKPA